MKWLINLFKRKEEPVDIAKLKESILEKLGEGKHIIHIMYKDREITLFLTEEEFNNAIIRGEQLNEVPLEEEIEETE
jgi:hypothetical protein